jgi:hypothetical protein
MKLRARKAAPCLALRHPDVCGFRGNRQIDIPSPGLLRAQYPAKNLAYLGRKLYAQVPRPIKQLAQPLLEALEYLRKPLCGAFALSQV